MQSKTFLLFLTAAALITFGGCDRHDWKDTRVLHEGHGGGHGGDHKDGEKEHGEKPPHGGDASPGKEAPHQKEAEPKATESPEGGDSKAKGKPRTL